MAILVERMMLAKVDSVIWASACHLSLMAILVEGMMLAKVEIASFVFAFHERGRVKPVLKTQPVAAIVAPGLPVNSEDAITSIV
jgi:hypothetical protein